MYRVPPCRCIKQTVALVTVMTTLSLLGLPLLAHPFYRPPVAQALSVTTGATPAPTPTYIPTQTAIPAVATPTPTQAQAVATLVAGDHTSGVLSLQVNVAATTPNGTKTQIRQTMGMIMPAGAVTGSVALKIGLPALGTVPELTGDVGEQNNAGIGMVYEVDATNISTGQTVHQLSPQHPVILQFTYDPSQIAGVDPTTLRVCYFDLPTGDWRPLPTTVDTFHHILTATTDHFTLFAVRVTARTQAQINTARARLAALSAAGPPDVSALPVSQASVGGVPLVITVPNTPQHAPLSVEITGAPHLRLQIVFTLAGATTVQSLALDAHGYAATAFIPSPDVTTAQTLHVAVGVAHGNAYAATRTLTLLPGRSHGPLPPGAPMLGATLSTGSARAGATSPQLFVTTATHAAILAVLGLTGVPLTGVNTVMAIANAQGVAILTLPILPGTVFNTLAQTMGTPLHLQVMVTSTLHGESTQVTLPLTVTR